MGQGIRRSWEAVAYPELTRAYPPPPEYYESRYFEEPDAIERRQLARMKARAREAAKVPFFAARWDKAGFKPEDIRCLADVAKAPMYTVDDIRLSIEAHPPFGDYQGAAVDEICRDPLRLYMSGGTTGKSRPTLYTHWDREVGAILAARGLYQQGIRPGDVVLNAWSYGTHNGAWNYDDALHKWLNCLVITTATGNVTSSERQIELARAYGATAITTTGDYLLRIAKVARDMGLDPRVDLGLRALPNSGPGDELEETFGVEYFATYGFHEVAWMATECSAHQGLHIYEDAFVVEVVDPDTGESKADGEPGSLVVTEVYKTGSPQFRYNTLDLSYLYPRERCECGSWLRRMGQFAGRADTMVKLRGVNIWPEALAKIAATVPGATSDYFARAVRRDGRDDLILSVVSHRPPAEFPSVRDAIESALHRQLGLKIITEVVSAGSLDELTQASTSPKAKRFRDER